MDISLKTRNAPKLLFVWVANVLAFCGIAAGALDISDVESVHALLPDAAKSLGANWPYIGLLAMVSVFNGAFPRPAKEWLVFWPASRPGSRAFSHFMSKDSTIDKKMLRERFGPLPTDPDEQNALWARWLNEFWDDLRVRPTYGLYLFARDWTVIAATLVLAAPLSLYFTESSGRALAYGVFLVCQFVIGRWVASVQGEQLVMSVLACKGSSVARSVSEGEKGKDD